MEEKKLTKSIVVPTMLDEIKGNSIWCGTFQLVWNDLKNEIVKKDIIFNPQEIMAENLNKEEFTKEMISEKDYYKIYGEATIELKEKIEKGINEKFNQTSDILDKFEWKEKVNEEKIKEYFFYTMLYKKFEFNIPFNTLRKDNWGTYNTDIEYFGAKMYASDYNKNKIWVLYYNSKDDFAIRIGTKDNNDQIIFCKKPQGNTFKAIYTDIIRKENEYTGNRGLTNADKIKIPKLDFNIEREYEEIEQKEFETLDKEKAEIEKTIQTIKLHLDEKGGEVKSEAAVKPLVTGRPFINQEDIRCFELDDTFAMFLQEPNKELPYLAIKVEDISEFQ